MPVPKRKRSRARRDSRFANKGIKVKTVNACSQCTMPLMSHTACSVCGYYKGIKVLACTKMERSIKRDELRKDRAKKRQDRSGQEPQAPQKEE